MTAGTAGCSAGQNQSRRSIHETGCSHHQALQVDDVREALSDIGVTGITVTEVKGFGRQRATQNLPRRRIRRGFPPKIKVEVAIDDDQLDSVIEAISAAAKTGKIGDGKIFVLRRAPGHPYPYG